MIKPALMALVAVFGVTSLSLPVDAQTTIRLGWATTDAETDSYAFAGRAFRDYLEELAPGQFDVRLFPNRQIGDEREMLQGLQIGTVHASIMTNSIVSNIVPAFQINDLPFLYGSNEQAHGILDGELGDRLFDQLAEQGVVGLAWCESGFRNMINNVRPVAEPDDVRGVKYRVMESPIFIGMYDHLGGNPVPMAWGDTFTAVQQGTVDGLEIPTWVIDAAKLYEVTHYLSLTRHVYTAAPLLMSKMVFDGLSPDDRETVRTAARQTCEDQRRFNAELEQQIIARLKEAGMEVNEVGNHAAFRERMHPVYADYRSEIGEDLMDAWMTALEN